MKGEKGQLFTFDMLLAMVLISLLVITTGQVSGMMREKSTGYVNSYSLERRASDAADILVRSSGKPVDWYRSSENLQVPGLADSTSDGEPIPNLLDTTRIGALSELMRDGNWDESNENVQAVMNLFGGENKFQIKLLDGDNCIWNLYPGWEPGSTSESVDSLDVTVSERIVTGRYGDLRVETGELPKEKAGVVKYPPENFWVGPDEIDTYDWYIVIHILGPEGTTKNIHIDINGSNYQQYNNIGSNWIEDGPIDSELIPGDNNSIQINNPAQELVFEAWVVAIPSGGDVEDVKLALKEIPLTLKVKVWR